MIMPKLNTFRTSVLAASAAMLLCSTCTTVQGFSTVHHVSHLQRSAVQPALASPTVLQVWWFGGAESSEVNLDDESCELVAVRIDRTSPNSRRIAGSITVATPLADVWAILTDYDRLAVHVPNLVESKILTRPSRGEQGDGSYRCKLFQKGAQKIIGFEFGASVTMEMTEKIVVAAASEGSATSASNNGQERMIGFKCVDSFFFSEFDGDWKAKERMTETGEVETELTYVVDVRPKGPVPVAALEWRIREDVPTNLRAVKKAAIEVGLAGVMASRQRSTRPLPSQAAASRTSTATRQPPTETNAIRRATVRRPNGANSVPARSVRRTAQPVAATRRVSQVNKAAPVVASAKPMRNVLQAVGRKAMRQPAANKTGKRTPLPFKVTWDADETMAAYLRE